MFHRRVPLVQMFFSALITVTLFSGTPFARSVIPPVTQQQHGNQQTHPYPWGNLTADRASLHDMPDTGVTRSYEFTISRAVMSPDGVERPMIVVNGQFPGPTIEANWGDWIEVTLKNDIRGPGDGAAIHWHGIRQIETPWMDGVPSTTQCPIPPGHSFKYRFRADEYGSSFWHSHVGSQYSAGAFGAIIVHGPRHPEALYDEDLGPVFLSDWYHADISSIVKGVVGLPAPVTQPYSDNNLINGRMPFDCTNPNITAFNRTCTSDNVEYSKFKFTRGKTYRLRLMNIGSQGMQRFTIDGMKMKVFAQDFIPVVPYVTDVVTIGIGQRTDVLVTATGSSTDAVWMRSDVSEMCSVSSQGHALAAIYYEDADTSVLPNTTATTYDESYCGNVPLSLTTPLYPIRPPSKPETTITLDIKFAANSTGNKLWFVNNETFRADFEHPLLLFTNQHESPQGQEQGQGQGQPPHAHAHAQPLNLDRTTYNVGSNHSVRIIINNYSFTNKSQHPIHFHGHDFWVVAEGVGKWDGVVTNTVNPMRRDTHILQLGKPDVGPGYMVMDFVTDNPGVWPLHCHLAWHASAGLFVNILERPDEIANLSIPDVAGKSCRQWTSFRGELEQAIDSGV
ncbi:Cupredoxin [Sordaria brevicollis]|uniref:Cupredoxin n=1 Tax=Sordaria brevicollis TaxID=83679 RepID=A0AAE0PFY0_SORBR|nr:Cupredoxin [Sordaria brevicollis]